MKKIGIFVVGLAAVVMLTACQSSAAAQRKKDNHYYVRPGTVTKVDYEKNQVTVTDRQGYEWFLSYAEDWLPGDGCLLIIDAGKDRVSINDDQAIAGTYTDLKID